MSTLFCNTKVSYSFKKMHASNGFFMFLKKSLILTKAAFIKNTVKKKKKNCLLFL